MRNSQNFWDKNAGRYDRFMRKDAAAYERLYRLLRPEMCIRDRPMTFLKTQSLWSLSLYLTDTTRDLALTMAASLFALLPAVLIFAFGQKYLEQGILAGAVKG